MEPSAIEPPVRLWARPDFQSLAFGRQGEVLAADLARFNAMLAEKQLAGVVASP